MTAAALFTTPEMASVFAPRAHVRAILRFEAALARAEARAGVIPREAAEAITAACDVDHFDVAALYAAAVDAGTLAIPIVRALTAHVGGGDDAGRFVHWGATSQDAIDTALVLQMRDGLGLLEDDLLALCAGCAAHAEAHRRTVMAGRTLLQQAVPITFGLKAARWLALGTRRLRALRALREDALALQLGGAAGTLAALGDHGLVVAGYVAEELTLPVPDLPWHAERDRVAMIAGAVGLAAGAMEKIATDIVLLAQTDVGEVDEGAATGKGGSSAMPHKHNPVDAAAALAATRLAAGSASVILAAAGAHQHERAVGAWQAEWNAIPDLFRYAAGAIAHARRSVCGLEVHRDRMAANLARGGGVVMSESLAMALAPHVGRPEAQRIVREAADRAAAEGNTLRDAALAHEGIRAALSPATVERALDPAAYLGSTDSFIDRALAAYRAILGRADAG